MNEISIAQTIIQGGVTGITVYLIWSWNRERNQTSQERKSERETWYQTVNTHMIHDSQLHEKHIMILQKLIDVVKSLEKRIDGKLK